MKIFVCVKQVPSTTKVEVDEKTGVLRRDGISSKMNPFDLFAIEAALALKEKCRARVTAITMGPPQAEAVIREAVMMGADDGFVITDRAFAGADVLATSRALAEGIRAAGDFDLILLGRQTTDGDTAQVGPELAEALKIPHAAWVSDIVSSDGGFIVKQTLQDSVETVFLPAPCLATVERDANSPRLPSLKIKRERAPIEVSRLTLASLHDQNPEHYGLAGSATKVERIFPPDARAERETISGADAGEKLAKKLRDWKFM